MNYELIRRWARMHISTITARSLSWTAVILLHLATIPGLLSVMVGLTDRMPPLDVVFLTWSGLVALYFQALIQRDLFLMTINTAGFITQSLLLALIFFR